MKKIISILTLGAVGIVISSNASALSYSDNVGVNFTFDQSLTVSLSNASGGSSADLVINGLAPGGASDSNVIDVNVLSNNLSGYTLTSTVGNDTHTNPSYDNTNLNHTDTMEAQLIDIRDNNIYWAAKLKDGHCWMTQNLDLNLDSNIALTSENTDLTDHSLTGAYQDGYTYDEVTGVTTWTPKNSTIDAVTDENTARGIAGYQNSLTMPYSVDVGGWYWSGARYDSSLCNVGNNYQTCNYVAKMSTAYSAYFSATPYENNGAHGHVGNYYNWSSSIASNNSASVTSPTIENIADNPQNSVCPADWRLPTIYGGATTDDARNEYFVLNKLYNSGSGSHDLEKEPLFFVRGGGVDGTMLVYAGFYDYYWSSTASGQGYAYRLYTNSDMIQPADGKYGGRGFGLSVRCLAR